MFLVSFFLDAHSQLLACFQQVSLCFPDRWSNMIIWLWFQGLWIYFTWEPFIFRKNISGMSFSLVYVCARNQDYVIRMEPGFIDIIYSYIQWNPYEVSKVPILACIATDGCWWVFQQLSRLLSRGWCWSRKECEPCGSTPLRSPV